MSWEYKHQVWPYHHHNDYALCSTDDISLEDDVPDVDVAEVGALPALSFRPPLTLQIALVTHAAELVNVYINLRKEGHHALE